MRGGIADYQKGIDIASADDDHLYVYENLMGLAQARKWTDPQEALDLYDRIYDLAKNLGVPYLIAEVLNDSALVYEAAGEYDMALHCHFKRMKVYEPPEGFGDQPAIILSRIYASLGDGESALEWADTLPASMGNYRSPTRLLRRARALIALGRLEEAASDLRTAQEMALREGVEAYIIEYNFVSGLLDMAGGDPLTAKQTWERTVGMLRVPIVIMGNCLYLALVKAEIALAEETPEGWTDDTSGPWMTKLEMLTRAHDMPGIAMQLALLKAEYYSQQGRSDDARGVLEEALEISDSPGVRTLRDRILDRIAAIDRPGVV